MNVTLFERSFSGNAILNDLNFDVNSMSWNKIGGTEAASVTAYGGTMDLWQLLNRLRCPVTIFDDHAKAIWWGYVAEVDVRVGTQEVRASLAEMSNRVAVAYSYIAPGSQDVGARQTTAWAEDAGSIAEFGYKELLSSQGGMSVAAAEARRAAIVAARRYPQAATVSGFGSPRGRVVDSGAQNSASATLHLQGWWKTLNWRYASVASGDAVTTAQISSLMTSYGQFIAATYIEAASGITAPQYRDGDTTAGTEIEELMDMGGAGGRDLMSWIDEQRRCFVSEEPAPPTSGGTVDLYMGTDGILANAIGVEVIDPAQIVGKWVLLRDVVPAIVDTTQMINPGLQFVDGLRWNNGGFSPEYRGQASLEEYL